MAEDHGRDVRQVHLVDAQGRTAAYTGSACIPMTLDDAAEAGKLRPGDHVVLCATGGGLATAAVLLRWGAS